MSNTKLLVLGSNGFIGRNLKEYFTRLDIFELLHPSHQELDLLNEEAVKRYLSKFQPDVIVNAAVCRNPRYFQNQYAVSELEQDIRMYYILEKYHNLYGKMLYFGSGAEYDKRSDICLVNENDYCNEVPVNEYGLAKYVIGKSIESSKNIYNLRIFGLFGKYENWKTTFISGACCKALKGIPITIRQNVVFDYLFIDDFCPITQWFIENTPKYHTYNISSGQKIDLITIAEKVNKVSGCNVPIIVCQPGFGKEYTADNHRLIAENTNFNATPIDESINRLLKYYKSIIETIDMLSLVYQ